MYSCQSPSFIVDWKCVSYSMEPDTPYMGTYDVAVTARPVVDPI